MSAPGHVHAFEVTGSGTHFPPVPNSRHVPRPVHTVACGCGQRGFFYHGSRVILTWSADWCTEEEHDAAQLRKSPHARARRP